MYMQELCEQESVQLFNSSFHSSGFSTDEDWSIVARETRCQHRGYRRRLVSSTTQSWPCPKHKTTP